MFELFVAFIGARTSASRPRASLVAESLALRQQLAVLHRQRKRPRLAPIDRAFWILLSGGWSRWTETLAQRLPVRGTRVG